MKAPTQIPKAYLDWAATAPLHPAARTAMADAASKLESGAYANPSSVHAPGRAARRALNAARETIAAFLRVPADALIFTSGGTEALALALNGADARERLLGTTEHPAVLEAAPGAIRIPVDREGRAQLPEIPAGALVAIQHANNETGVVQDMARIAEAVHAAGARLLADCVQSAGKLPIPPADFVAVSGHKLGGPAGIGALVVRCKDGFRPVQRGGGQEQGWRGGTENLLGAIGWAAALELWNAEFPARAAALQQRLETAAVEVGARVNGAGAPRLPTISSLHLPGVPAATQLMQLDMAGIAVSQGSACSSGTLKSSPTLEAMGLLEAAGQSLRISTGWRTTEAEIDKFLEAYAPLARKARSAA
ncbi:aminotransferase class V-fold PLP-dependent enzyme [Sandaracinobacter sp. RS1-74]|uniref:cysteine desulfurase family protein n=1 Tax=Sandaracinobacteroides sayramensis TaxID=2913411 RepID=UPI001EDBCF3B|nr:aminotransferase class V-fold PLP-dependent enzyme [Sandaracinobacteroides sayramensis]MCG2839384.1 aminotransferase class V-fold PLP-dependent enzyme [Sandaracinobacteroides sayramensis]